MDCYTEESSSFTLPVYSQEHKPTIAEYEKTAEKALRNINLMYNEIMAPKEYDPENSEIYITSEEKSISNSSIVQNHFVKTCCKSVKELCAKCDRIILRCTSCSHCKCSVSSFDKMSARISSENRCDNYQPSNSSNFEIKYTVPKPFSLCAKIEDYQKAKECKISKIKEDLEREIESELKIRTSCKPVPKSTHLPLYKQMIQDMEQRKVKRKEKCQEILNNTKPFNLHSSLKNSVKAKSTTDLTFENAQFKAKPIPKHILDNKISENLKNKEEIRKLLISERAKQTIEKSSLPFSQKPIPCTRSCVDLSAFNQKQKKEDSKTKNISEITKRLYVKKCSVTIGNWNKKVLQVDADKGKMTQKMCSSLNEYTHLSNKQLSKKEMLPFMYFPIRMSNASLMREKQIR